MKRTLIAVGIAVLISMMLMPMEHKKFIVTTSEGYGGWMTETIMRPFFVPTYCDSCYVLWTPFWLQTLFLAVAAAVIVNLFRRRPRS